MPTGLELIANERQRQIDTEGWSPEHDAEHTGNELIKAAVCYAFLGIEGYQEVPVHGWPWERSWWKPSTSRVRNLVKAGALIAAEIDRLQRPAVPLAAPTAEPELCEYCPPVGYPSNRTRCTRCPRLNAALNPFPPIHCVRCGETWPQEMPRACHCFRWPNKEIAK